jgi:hypothetical protein
MPPEVADVDAEAQPGSANATMRSPAALLATGAKRRGLTCRIVPLRPIGVTVPVTLSLNDSPRTRPREQRVTWLHLWLADLLLMEHPTPRGSTD